MMPPIARRSGRVSPPALQGTLPAPAMTVQRLRPIAKLVLLFGTPLAIVFGLFGAGVYWGVENQSSIAAFERWLGFEGPKVITPAPAHGPPRTVARDDSAPAPATGPIPDPSEVAAPAAGTKVDDAPIVLDRPVEPASESFRPTPVETVTDPLEGALDARLAMPVVVTVKVLVDPMWAELQPHWIDDVQRTVREASQVFQKQFGIALELQSVGRWATTSEGMPTSALLEELNLAPREGADLLLGLTGVPSPEVESDAWHRPPLARDAPVNRAYGLVYALPRGGPRPHLRPLLREVSSMLGAQAVSDPADPSFQAGSWMSDAVVNPTQAPWIDVENRARVLERKVKPFAPEVVPVERNTDGTEE